MSAERFGIFGGTFDPPHLGHLILAAEARDELGIDEVLFVLTGDPPHKERQTPVETRVLLLEAALEGQEGFRLSRVEVDRPGPHYAADTMRLLREEFPGQELVYLLGGDSLQDLPDWDRPKEFLANCDALGVMRRPGTMIALDELEAALPGISDKVEFIQAPLLDIASRDVRQRVRDDEHYQYYLPPRVYELVKKLELYR